MRVSFVIVTYNSENTIIPCIESILSQEDIGSYEIIVVDNASSDRTMSRLRPYRHFIKVIEMEYNSGFACGNNAGLRCAKGEYAVLVNPDAVLFEDSTKHLLKTFDVKDNVGIVGGQIIDAEQTIRPFPRLSNLWSYLNGKFKSYNEYKHIEEIDWICGAYCAFNLNDIKKIGYFDERFFLYYEETDLCLRLKNIGKKNYINHLCKLKHIGGGSDVEKTHKYEDKEKMISEFKYISKLLYFKKNEGFFKTILMTLFEISAYSAVVLKKLFSKKESDKNRVAYSKKQIKSLLYAISVSKFGFYSPKAPWRVL